MAEDKKPTVNGEGLKEVLTKAKDMDLVNRVGNLYKDLGEDAVPELADHLTDMQGVQDDIETLNGAFEAASGEVDRLTEENANLKQKNAELMYSQMRSSQPDEPEDDGLNADDKEIEDLDEKLADFDAEEEE